MEVSKQQMVEFAQWMDDAARTIEKWAQHAPDYFKKKGRLLVDVDRFDERAQAIRDFLAAAKAAECAPTNPAESDRAKDVLEGREEGMHVAAQAFGNLVDRAVYAALTGDTPAPGQPPNDNMKNETCVKE